MLRVPLWGAGPRHSQFLPYCYSSAMQWKVSKDLFHCLNTCWTPQSPMLSAHIWVQWHSAGSGLTAAINQKFSSKLAKPPNTAVVRVAQTGTHRFAVTSKVKKAGRMNHTKLTTRDMKTPRATCIDIQLALKSGPPRPFTRLISSSKFNSWPFLLMEFVEISALPSGEKPNCHKSCIIFMPIFKHYNPRL